jgi:hypothetical protein
MGFHWSAFPKPKTEFNSDVAPCYFWAFPTMNRELWGKKFRSNQRFTARFREMGGALQEVHHLSREVLRKRDRHRTSTKFRLGVINWVHELCKRPSYKRPLQNKIDYGCVLEARETAHKKQRKTRKETFQIFSMAPQGMLFRQAALARSLPKFSFLYSPHMSLYRYGFHAMMRVHQTIQCPHHYVIASSTQFRFPSRSSVFCTKVLFTFCYPLLPPFSIVRNY